MQWYPHYTGDYKRSTDHLSMLEHGAYRLLLDHYYDRDGNVQADEDRLFRICKALTDNEKNAVRFIIDEFFSCDDGMLSHARADIEIEKRAEKSEKASKSARRMWEKKKGSSKESDANAYANALANADANAEQTHMLTTTTSTTIEERYTTPAKADVIEWWNAVAKANGIPTIRKISDGRWGRFRRRCAEGIWVARSEIDTAIGQSSFIRNGTWFTFDWICENDSNWLKLTEGAYADKGAIVSKPANHHTGGGVVL